MTTISKNNDLIQLLTKKPYLDIYLKSQPKKCPFVVHYSTGHEKKSEYLTYQEKTQEAIKPLSSTTAPKKEALAILKNYKIQSQKIILCLGMTSPEVLDLIARKLSSQQICIVVDYHIEIVSLLIKQSLKTWQFLMRPGCHVFAGKQMETALWQYISAIPIDHIFGYTIIKIPSAIRLQPTYYEYIEKKFIQLLSLKYSDLLTQLKFDTLWFENTMKNSHFLFSAIRGKPAHKSSLLTLYHYRNCLKNKPAILIGSGPSLHHEIENIKQLQQRAFVLTVSSALPIIKSHNITPHAMVNLDAQLAALLPMLGQVDPNLIIFTDIVSHPSIALHHNQNPLIFFTSQKQQFDASGKIHEYNTPGVEMIEEWLPTPIGNIISGGSVATSGFNLLHYLGCNPIILCGHDLQYSYRMIHAKGANQYLRWQTHSHRCRSVETTVENAIQSRSTHTNSDTTKESPRDFILDIYFEWFYNRLLELSHNTKVVVYNFTQPTLRRLPSCYNLCSEDEKQKLIIKLAKNFTVKKTPLYKAQPVPHYLSETKIDSFLTEIQTLLNDLSTSPADRQKQAELLILKYPFIQKLLRAHKIQAAKKKSLHKHEFAKALWSILPPLVQKLQKFISGVKHV